jgi:hypothetical protein
LSDLDQFAPKSGLIVRHPNAVWGSHAHHDLVVDLTRFRRPRSFEALPVAKAPDDLWMICCLPFFCYGYSLWDLVCNEPNEGAVVVHRSGRQLIRLFIDPASNVEQIHIELHEWVDSLGFLHEWHAPGLLAIDVPDAQHIPNWDAIQKWIDKGNVFAEDATNAREPI